MSERQNTNNTLPSNTLADLNDNTLVIDEWTNSNNDFTQDRFGKKIKTRYKIESELQKIIDDTHNTSYLSNVGGILTGDLKINKIDPRYSITDTRTKNTGELTANNTSLAIRASEPDFTSVLTRFRYTTATKVWNFENVSSVTINNTPILKQNDFGVGNNNLYTSQMTDDLSQSASFVGCIYGSVPPSIKNTIGNSSGVVGITLPYRTTNAGTKYSARFFFEIENTAKDAFLQHYVNNSWQKPIKVVTESNISNYLPKSVILYPNGTESSPATLMTNQRIVITNPYLSLNCYVTLELSIDKGISWATYNQMVYSSSNGKGYGAVVNLYDTKIIIQTGDACILAPAKNTGSPFGNTNEIVSPLFRVRVIKLIA